MTLVSVSSSGVENQNNINKVHFSTPLEVTKHYLFPRLSLSLPGIPE